MSGASTVDIMRAIFWLEAERTVCAARLGRVTGAERAMAEVDQRLASAFAALDERQALYPLHMLARRYQLSEEDYLILQLALLGRHMNGAELVRQATGALDDPDDVVRMSHALALIAEGFDDWERAKAELVTFPVFAEKLVRLEGDDADPTLVPSPAVLELLGLA